MIFILSFYIFSIFLAYLDCTRYKIPNVTLGTLLIFLLLFGFIEDQLHLYSFIISFIVLLFFVIMILLMPKMILGGGDIKYLMVIAIYLNPIVFPLFLLFTGIIQMLFLIYFQKFRKRHVAPMAPAMFLAVVLSEVFTLYGIYP